MVLLNLWNREKKRDRDSTNISTLPLTCYLYHEQVEGSERNYLVVLFEELVDGERDYCSLPSEGYFLTFKVNFWLVSRT